MPNQEWLDRQQQKFEESRDGNLRGANECDLEVSKQLLLTATIALAVFSAFDHTSSPLTHCEIALIFIFLLSILTSIGLGIYQFHISKRHLLDGAKKHHEIVTGLSTGTFSTKEQLDQGVKDRRADELVEGSNLPTTLQIIALIIGLCSMLFYLYLLITARP